MLINWIQPGKAPISVVKRIGKLNYEIQWTKDGKKHKRVVHLNHLKPYNEQFLISSSLEILPGVSENGNCMLCVCVCVVHVWVYK